MFLWPGDQPHPGLSVCTSVVFLAAGRPAAAMTLGLGREGARKGGAGGGLGGTLGAVGKGAPVVSPRPEVSRPQAVRCRGGRPGAFGGGTSGWGDHPGRPPLVFRVWTVTGCPVRRWPPFRC
jgi:hypothetical protein